MSNEYKRLSQIDAQILNDYIKNIYEVRVGWVAIYGKKNCERLSAWLNDEWDFTTTPQELAQVIE